MRNRNCVLLICAAGLLSSACFVDLERSEAVLGIFIDGAGEGAAEVSVEVNDLQGLPPFSSRFPLTDAALQMGPPSLALPDITVSTGTVVVTARTLDEVGRVVDEPISETIDLVPGRNGLTIDFKAPPVLDPADPPMDGGGAENSAAIVTAAAVVSSEPDSDTLRVELSVDQTEWAAALSKFQTDLQASPMTLVVQGINVFSEGVSGDSAETFDDIWEDTVRLRLQGGSLDAEAGSFVPGSFVQIEAQIPVVVDVTDWLTLPVGAVVVLSGEMTDDGLEVPLGLSVTLNILATR